MKIAINVAKAEIILPQTKSETYDVELKLKLCRKKTR